MFTLWGPYLEKKFKNDGNQKYNLFRRIFALILGWFWPFYVVFCPFASFLVPNDGNQRQDADFFPGMMGIYEAEHFYDHGKVWK